MQWMRLTIFLLSALAGVVQAKLSEAKSAKIKVVASFSIISDLVANVGGDEIDLTTIVGPDSDTHAFEPKPDDAKRLANAQIVFANGLAFEPWLDRLLAASGFAGELSRLSDGIAAAELDDETDPHAWQSVSNVEIYVRNIAAALCRKDAANCPIFAANAQSYTTKLQELDAGIKTVFAKIPADRRTVITSHDAFGYFAKAYGVTFLAPEGINNEAEASAGDVAKLIVQIRDVGATALFVENISNPRLLEQIAGETGLRVGGKLYSDALSGPEGKASTYIDMMRHNAGLLVTALENSGE
jgi:zinc/manganese transport system substrate-binding protein